MDFHFIVRIGDGDIALRPFYVEILYIFDSYLIILNIVLNALYVCCIEFRVNSVFFFKKKLLLDYFGSI